MITILIAALALVVIFSQEAYAYIDPGSGSFFLQILLSVLLGFLYSLRIYWKRILGAVTGRVK